MGAISNVTEDGFAPAAFHAYPSTLEIDGYSGDYGPGFLGFVINTGSYLVQDGVFGWLGFGGSVRSGETFATLYPRDAGRFRVYVAPVGLWLELDAGTFKSVSFDAESKAVEIELDGSTVSTPFARLRFSTPGSDLEYRLSGEFALEREAYVIDLAAHTNLVLRVK